MKKLFAILLLFVFSTQFLPAIKSLVCADAVSIIDLEEEQSPEKKKENTSEKKEIKDFLSTHFHATIEAVAPLTYIYSAGMPGDSPAINVITPPPNKA